MAHLLIGHGDLEGQRVHLVGAVDDEVLRGIGTQVGQGRADVDLDGFGSALTHANVVGTAHVLLDVLGEVITSGADALVAHDTTQRDHSDLGRTTTDVNNHVALGGQHVETDTQSGCHGLVNHVNVTSASMLTGVADGADLDLGRTRGDTYDHAQRG